MSKCLLICGPFHFPSTSPPQDPLESGSNLEGNLGMDMDAEAVRDAENNINTARWVELICQFNLTIYLEEMVLIERN